MRTSPLLIPVTFYLSESGRDDNIGDLLLLWLRDRAKQGVRDFTLHEAFADLEAAGHAPKWRSLRGALKTRLMNEARSDMKATAWTAAPTPVVTRTAPGHYRFVGTMIDGMADSLPGAAASPSSLGAAVMVELAAFQAPGNRTFTTEVLCSRLAERGHVVTEDAVSEELTDLHVIGAVHLSILRDGRYRLVAKSRKPKSYPAS